MLTRMHRAHSLENYIFIGKAPEIHLHVNRLVFKMKEIKNTSLSNETPIG